MPARALKKEAADEVWCFGGPLPSRLAGLASRLSRFFVVAQKPVSMTISTAPRGGRSPKTSRPKALGLNLSSSSSQQDRRRVTQ